MILLANRTLTKDRPPKLLDNIPIWSRNSCENINVLKEILNYYIKKHLINKNTL